MKKILTVAITILLVSSSILVGYAFEDQTSIMPDYYKNMSNEERAEWVSSKVGSENYIISQEAENRSATSGWMYTGKREYTYAKNVHDGDTIGYIKTMSKWKADDRGYVIDWGVEQYYAYSIGNGIHNPSDDTVNMTHFHNTTVGISYVSWFAKTGPFADAMSVIHDYKLHGSGKFDYKVII